MGNRGNSAYVVVQDVSLSIVQTEDLTKMWHRHYLLTEYKWH
ncbi:hypothetical protein [Chamaesiphon sp.]